MRLGAYPAALARRDPRAAMIYGEPKIISERHRHRFEVNNRTTGRRLEEARSC